MDAIRLGVLAVDHGYRGGGNRIGAVHIRGDSWKTPAQVLVAILRIQRHCIAVHGLFASMPAKSGNPHVPFTSFILPSGFRAPCLSLWTHN